MPLVSVVVPARDAAATIALALGSALAQSHRDLEVIVVDDGSSDGTAAAAAALSPAITVIAGEGRGAGPARNDGIRRAAGELVAFLDADDVWRRDKLARQLAAMAARPGAAWSYTDAFLFTGDPARTLYRQSERHALPDGDVARPLALGDFIVASSVLAKRAALAEAGPFPARRHAEDWALWLRLAARHPVACVAEALTGYRVHSPSASADPLDDHRDRIAAIDEAIAFAPAAYLAVRRKALARAHVKTGVAFLARGRTREARGMLLRAWRLDPVCPAVYPRLAVAFLGARAARALLAHRRAAAGLDGAG